MKSTSTSEIFKIPVLKVENLNLVYRLSLQRSYSWRDAFTKFSKSPLETLKPTKERLQILKDINLTVHKGERVGLLGVNGAGKSSLCRCISGMFNPTSGTITRNAPIRAIFDTGVGIQPELTGRENALLLGHFLYPEEKDIPAIVNEALEFSELGKFVDVPYKLYSSGMQARLYLSMISARPTGLLILDEVFDGADAFFREKISARVMSMIQASGAAIFVSHSFEQIKRVCNRVVIIHHSEIAYDGAPDLAIGAFQNLRPAAVV